MSDFDDYLPLIGGMLTAALAIPLAAVTAKHNWMVSVIAILMGAAFLVAGLSMTIDSLERKSKSREMILGENQ